MPEQPNILSVAEVLALSADALTECVAGALETMAFISVGPAEPPVLPPAEAMLVRICFSGAMDGRLELVVSGSLGRQLAANALGVAENDPAAAERGQDAVTELANVVCGSLLTRIGGDFEMGLPSVLRFDAEGDWDAFVACPCSCVVDAEGTNLAARRVNEREWTDVANCQTKIRRHRGKGEGSRG